MKLSLFSYHLDQHHIAQYPLESRDSSRLLVLKRSTGEMTHCIFKDISDFFQEGDLLILNNTKVLPARLYGKKLTGGKVDVLLVKKITENTWSALVRGIGEGIIIFNGNVKAEVKRNEKEAFVTFSNGKAEELMKDIGQIPLPPYIKRAVCNDDKKRYQTVYAKEDGAIAAPTAGLHFTQDILKKIEDKRVNIHYITLHVGLGTFKPITSDTVEGHTMDQENYFIPHSTARSYEKVKAQGGRVCAVGTTVTRTLESAFYKGKIEPGHGVASLFISPGYTFNAIDMFITNFHLPCSSPLVLTAAFAGIDLLKKAYGEAQKRGYRFYSYGDAMLIL